MNIAGTICFDGLKSMPVPKEMIPFRDALIALVELHRKDLLDQLRAQPDLTNISNGQTITGWTQGGVVTGTAVRERTIRYMDPLQPGSPDIDINVLERVP